MTREGQYLKGFWQFLANYSKLWNSVAGVWICENDWK